MERMFFFCKRNGFWFYWDVDWWDGWVVSMIRLVWKKDSWVERRDV